MHVVTEYDLFEYLYEKGSSIKAQDIVKAFNKADAEYHNTYRILQGLEKNRLIIKNKYGFQAIRSQRSDILYRIIKFCIANKINYNELLDKNVARFISEAVVKSRISINNFKMNPRTFSKYIGILSKCGFLVILSRKPFEAVVPYNSFLKDLTVFFGFKINPPKYAEKNHIREIESELKKFNRLKKKNNRRYVEIIDEYEIKFIQHSLNLEGNPITLPDTIKLLREHIIPRDLSIESVQEVQNYQRAIKDMIKGSENKKPLTKEAILNYHYLAMQHKPQIAGKIRTVSVHIKGNPKFKVSKPEEIYSKLDKLLKEYNSFHIMKRKHIKEILDFSSYFHNEFQHIHPFEDGNSRTTRLIMFHLLRMEKFPMLDIPLGLLEEYLFSTKGSNKRNDKKLNQVIQRIILYNLKTINERMQ